MTPDAPRWRSYRPTTAGDWQELGVALLHRLVMETLLGATNLPKPMYVHSVDEVIHALTHGDTTGRDATGQEGSGGKFNLAALVMPATVDHVRAISEHGRGACRPRARISTRSC